MKVTFRVQGSEEIKELLNNMPKEVSHEHLQQVALDAAEIIRKEAEDRAPKRTGTLAGDIHKEFDDKELTGVKVQVKIGPGKKGWYGRLVEMGTKFAAPKPWLRPAFDAKKKEAQQYMLKEFKRRLKLK